MTRRVDFSFTLPDWWPTKQQLTAIWKTAVYRVRPDKCHVCGQPVDFCQPTWMGKVRGKAIAVHQNSTKPICTNCLSLRIKTYYNQATLKRGRCHCCEQTTRVTGGITEVGATLVDEYDYRANKAIADRLDLSVVYGMEWWNGYDFCEKCVTKLLKSTQPHCSATMQIHKTLYHVNHKGALIPIEKEPK